MVDASTPDGGVTLPSFATPPLLEVALAVEFVPISNFGATAMSLLARDWSSEYPHVQEHPPLPPAGPPGFGMTPGVLVNVGAPQLRLWLLTESGDRVVQLQRDRLIVNWRSGSEAIPYPRYYDALRPEFAADFDRLTTHLVDHGFTVPQVVVAEVTYVNLIQPVGGGDLVDVLRSQSRYDHHLGAPTHTSIDQTWPRPGGQGADGTLTAQAEVSDGRAMLTLTARSAMPDGQTRDVVLASLDRCHDDVVSAFVEMTETRWHQAWGRIS